ncbi:response regulator [Paenibacillus sp. TRM 82003]|nr:response regulator [Paenibacillus sp. TRM 82003]
MLKLLIVDDELVILQGILKIVREGKTPFTRIESAADAFEALSLLPDFKPDVMITDITMPEKNGLELIAKAKEQRMCERFIILTGYDEFTYAKQALRMKVIDYLLKPIDKMELLTLLRRVANEIMEEHRPDGLEEAAPSSEYSIHIEKILHHIQKHYQRDLSLEHLSELTDLHPGYISSLFKSEVGMSFVQYLQEHRMEKAKEIMTRHQTLPVQIVANQVGYENPQHFMKVFKKVVGCTPGSYREQCHPQESESDQTG